MSKPSRKIDTYEATRELDRRALALIMQGVDLATAYRRASGIKICTYCGGKGKYSPSPLISMMAECPNCKGAGDVRTT